MAIIDKIQISGTNYDIKDASATTVVNVTQAEYDDLVTGGTLDPSVLYNITDATPIDISQFWTSAQTNSAINEAVSGKLDTSVFQTYSGGVDTALANKVETSAITTAVTTASTDSEIPTAKAVNDAIAAGGGSSITIDPSLNSGSTNPVANSAITNAINSKVSDISFDTDMGVKRFLRFSTPNSFNKFLLQNFKINGTPVLKDGYVTSDNLVNYNLVPSSAITTSITSSSTDTQVPSAKAVYDALQGGGGGGGITSGEVQVMIDESISGKADANTVTEVNNALTAHTANTQIHVTTAQTAAWDAKSDFSGSYNDLTNKPTIPTTTSAVTSGSTDVVESGAVYDQMGGMKILHLTQAQYDALSPNYDNTTLYVITNS